MFSNRPRDPFDDWQYLIFRVILFIIFVHLALQFLDDHTHLFNKIKVLYDFFFAG
jgi:hypothetical protein